MSVFLEERHLELKRRTQAFAESAQIEKEHDPRVLVAQLGRAELLKACVPAASGALAASCSGAHISSISPMRAPISIARSTERFQT